MKVTRTKLKQSINQRNIIYPVNTCETNWYEYKYYLKSNLYENQLMKGYKYIIYFYYN